MHHARGIDDEVLDSTDINNSKSSCSSQKQCTDINKKEKYTIQQNRRKIKGLKDDMNDLIQQLNK